MAEDQGLARLVVVHDELDLPSGRVKVEVGGGTAGHNGLKSIDSHLHTDDYLRVRIGIGKPPGRQPGADYVLKRPGSGASGPSWTWPIGGGRRRRRGHPRRRRRGGHEPVQQHRRDRADPVAPPRYPERVSLRSLPALLRNEPAMARVIGASERHPGRAHPGPGLRAGRAGPARAPADRCWSSRRPGAAAERLAHDLDAFTAGARRRAPGRGVPGLGDPALRAGQPEVATMGRRLRLLWQLGRAEAGTTGPARTSWWPRSRPCSSGSARGARAARPVVVAKGDRLVVDELVARLVAHGLPARVPGRAPRRAGRAGRDRRRLPVDRRRAGADRPVGRRGRPADRVRRRRPAVDRRPRPRSSCSAAGSCCPTRTCGSGPPAWWARRPGAATSGSGWPTATSSTGWSRGCRGWSTPRSCVTDLLAPTTPWSCWSSPAGCATGPASCSTRRRRWPTPWPDVGARGRRPGRPRLHVPFDRLLAEHRRRRCSRWSRRPRARTSRLVESRGWEPILGRRGQAGRPGPEPGRGGLLGRAVLADGRREPSGWPAILAEEGLVVPVVEPSPDAEDRRGSPPDRRDRPPARGADRGGRARPGLRPARGPRWPCWPSPTSPAGAGPTARPGPGPGRSTASSTTWPRATTSSTASTGWPATAAWSPGPWAASTRDYLLLEYRGGDKLYLPTDQIELLTPYTGGESPDAQPAGRLGVAAGPVQGPGRGARDRRGAGRALPAAARRSPATPSGPTPRGRPSSRRPSPSSRPPTSSGPSRTSRPTWSGPSPWTGWSAATSASARPRWPSGPCSRRSRTASRPPCWCRPRCWPASTSRPSPTATPPFPVRVEMLSRVPDQRPGQDGASAGLADGSVDVVIGTHRLLGGDVTFKNLGPAGGRRGAALRGQPQGGDQGPDRRGRRAHPDRQPHPPHPRDGPDRHPRPVHGQHPAGGPPADPHPRRRVRGGGRRPRPSGASCCARARSSTSTTGSRTSRRWPTGSGGWSPRPGWRWPTARWTRAPSSRSSSTSGRARYDVLVCTTIIESGIDMPTVNTLVVDRADLLGLGQLHQLRGRVGRAGQRAYAYLFHPGRPGPVRAGLRAPADHRRPHRARLRASRSPCATCRSGARATCSGGDQSGHIAAVGYDLYVQMVSEAVAELKGEPLRPAGRALARPARRRPPARRLRRGRRTSASRPTGGWPACAPWTEVDDVRTEWEDRFGPLPGAGRGPARRGPPAGRVPPARDHRRGRDCPARGVRDRRRRRRAGHGQAVPGDPARLGGGPAPPAGPGGQLARGSPAPAGSRGRRRARAALRPGPGGAVAVADPSAGRGGGSGDATGEAIVPASGANR